ncbi:MAG: pantoate--beta-alanine ligase [Bacteroidaceae bacterium]|jgi:pantoate--beta-alanine ligase|nr:pantoate--beta-alanine ligase [Bacteroidaceae bacterium]
MEIIRTIRDLDEKLANARLNKEKIGLVPTMGALHAGHASLVRRSIEENNITIVSDFVNPTQFNDKNDLLHYPRTFESDCSLLEKLGANYVFYPSVSEMYPEPDTRAFNYPPVDTVMEGAQRPGHFNGVCQIVSKLFYAIKPDKAYFGEKDFQQIAVIKVMVNDLKIPVQICSCPIVREPDGLALSSRNALLSEEERHLAVHISKTLFASQDYAKSHTVAETQKYVVNTINKYNGLKVQYYEIVDGDNLLSVNDWNESKSIVGCITVFCGKTPVRLIDNIRYK